MMNQQETAKYLGITDRVLRKYTRAGHIAAQPVPGSVGPRLEYLSEDVERLRRELYGEVIAAPMLALPAPAETPPTEHQALPQPSLFPVTRGLEQKLLLTLDEANSLTSISQSTLRKAIDGGTLKAAHVGRKWLVRPCDLTNYVVCLVEGSIKPTLQLPALTTFTPTAEVTPLAIELLSFIDRYGQWRGTARQLLDELDQYADEASKAHDWPRNANSLGMRLNHVQGVDVARVRRHKGRFIHLRRGR